MAIFFMHSLQATERGTEIGNTYTVGQQRKKMIHTIKMKQNKKIAVAPRVVLHPKYDDLHE